MTMTPVSVRIRLEGLPDTDAPVYVDVPWGAEYHRAQYTNDAGDLVTIAIQCDPWQWRDAGVAYLGEQEG